MSIIIRFPRFIAAIAALFSAVFVFASAPVHAQSACKGLSKSSCTSNNSCSFVNGFTRSDGAKVKAFCRAKPGSGKSAKKSTSKKTSSKKASTRSTTKTAKKPAAKKASVKKTVNVEPKPAKKKTTKKTASKKKTTTKKKPTVRKSKPKKKKAKAGTS